MSDLNNPFKPNLRTGLYLKAMKDRAPIHGSFELTPRCNLNCKMCYIRMSEKEMCSAGREWTANQWIDFGKVCRDKGMLFLLLTGGEPFFRKDFKEIYTELNKMGFIITINSNGILITDEVVCWLKKCPPSKIRITLYGGSNETYSRLCGDSHGFDKVTAAIDRLLEAGIAVALNASFTPYNVCDIEAIYDFAKKRKLKVKPMVYMFPPIRRFESENKVLRFTEEEAGQALFRTKMAEMDSGVLYWFIKRMQQGFRADEDDGCIVAEEENMGCIAGKCSFWITWDGRMTPCGMMNQPVVNPKEKSFDECWDYIVKETDKIFLPKACTRCEHRNACTVCGALAVAEGHGDSTVKPEYLCGITDEYLRQCQSFVSNIESLVKAENEDE